MMKIHISSIVVLFALMLCSSANAGLHTFGLKSKVEREQKEQQTDSLRMLATKEKDTSQKQCWYCKPYSVLSGEIGGSFASYTPSINYEYAFMANTEYNVFVRAGLGGNWEVNMINTGALLGFSTGGKNSVEVNAGVIGDIYYNVPSKYSDTYGRGLKPVVGLYYRYYGEKTVFRVGISFLSNPEKNKSLSFPSEYSFGISYGFMF